MTDKKTIWISGNPIDIATIFTLVSSKSEESRGEIALLGTRKVYKHLAFSEYSFKKTCNVPVFMREYIEQAKQTPTVPGIPIRQFI